MCHHTDIVFSAYSPIYSPILRYQLSTPVLMMWYASNRIFQLSYFLEVYYMLLLIWHIFIETDKRQKQQQFAQENRLAFEGTRNSAWFIKSLLLLLLCFLYVVHFFVQFRSSERVIQYINIFMGLESTDVNEKVKMKWKIDTQRGAVWEFCWTMKARELMGMFLFDAFKYLLAKLFTEKFTLQNLKLTFKIDYGLKSKTKIWFGKYLREMKK